MDTAGTGLSNLGRGRLGILREVGDSSELQMAQPQRPTSTSDRNPSEPESSTDGALDGRAVRGEEVEQQAKIHPSSPPTQQSQRGE
ncbi:hypothetical protein ZWY2020_052186 [Hordeum vulgare]|nr:hypothetical protein ZWY2020_052186 [Hordeum vulgare]